MRERAWPYGYIIADPDFRFETPDAPEPYKPDINKDIGDFKHNMMDEAE
jgi:hypothetical protein